MLNYCVIFDLYTSLLAQSHTLLQEQTAFLVRTPLGWKSNVTVSLTLLFTESHFIAAAFPQLFAPCHCCSCSIGSSVL